jgi:hypothetical protein
MGNKEALSRFLAKLVKMKKIEYSDLNLHNLVQGGKIFCKISVNYLYTTTH